MNLKDIMNLKDKVALITGAGTGIGAATARLMAAEGARVAIAGIPAEAVQAVAAELTSAGHAALAIPTDVSAAAQIESAVAQTVARFGRLDILVPNAGIQLHTQDVNLHELPEEVWDKTHNVNYRGVYLTCRAGLAQFMQQGDGGVIVIVASVTALSGRSHNPAYMAGKHGLLGLTRYIAVHYGKYGIRCNAVSPGALERTPNHDIHPDAAGRAERFSTLIPLGRLGKPEDIAPFITFLSTAAASYANGANFVVDGGFSVT
ncbi:MAG: SDR family oxidoreductase [Caldilineaceae bacterium]|nr:SDR family oxidoreductase [Caldilineaceae bacterium]